MPRKAPASRPELTPVAVHRLRIVIRLAYGASECVASGGCMSEQGWKEFVAAEGVDDWAVLHGGATAVFRIRSIGQGAEIALALAGIPGFEG